MNTVATGVMKWVSDVRENRLKAAIHRRDKYIESLKAVIREQQHRFETQKRESADDAALLSRQESYILNLQETLNGIDEHEVP